MVSCVNLSPVPKQFTTQKEALSPFSSLLLPATTPTDEILITLPTAEAKRDLPALSHDGKLPIRRYLRIRREGNYCTLLANVYWQVGGKWRSLWQADPTDPNGERSPYRLVRTNNSRLTD